MMRTPPETTRRLCCAVDAKDYSSRTPADQYDLQADLVGLLAEAAQGARLARLAWKRQESGDGELALLPPNQSESVLIDDFVRELDAALHRHNRVRLPQSRLRLRMAVHFGVVFPAPNGYAGPAAVVVSRLLDSRPLKQALEAAHGADLVVGLSDGVYQDTVAGGLTKTLAGAFRRGEVDDEKYRGSIWIRTVARPGSGADSGAEPAPPAQSALPGSTQTQARATVQSPQPAPEPSAGPGTAVGRPLAPHVQNIFHGNVEAEVIGFNFNEGSL